METVTLSERVLTFLMMVNIWVELEQRLGGVGSEPHDLVRPALLGSGLHERDVLP